MPEKDDLEHLLDQIHDLIRMAQEKQPEELEGQDVPLNLEQKLGQLERNIEKFQELNKDILSQKNLTEEHVDDIQQNLQDIHPKDRLLIEYAGRIATKIKEAQKNLESVIEETKSTRDIEPRKPKEGSRRSKFKRVGGQKNWKPL